MKPRIRVNCHGNLFSSNAGVGPDGNQFRIHEPLLIIDDIPTGEIEKYSDSLIGDTTKLIIEYFNKIHP